MSFLRKFLTVALLLLCVGIKADQVDDSIRALIKSQKVPGLVYGVFQDGKILRSGAYGVASLELEAPITLGGVFEIGSVSKQFTATLVLMAMEQGKVALDDQISRYVENLPQAWQPVTLRQLLQHTSGIPDIEDIFGYESYRNIYTPEKIIGIANSKPMDFPPGTQWRYSNTGYYLLALAVQKAEGVPFDTLLKQKIFGPLGMTHSSQSDPSVVIPGRVSGYKFQEKGWVNRDPMQPSACLGAGTIVSTLEDMAKWDRAITRHTLLRPESQNLMWAPTKLSPTGGFNYGFGWFIGHHFGVPTFSHTGSTAGFSCVYRRYPQFGESVMVFSNTYAEPAIFNVANEAMTLLHPNLSYRKAMAIQLDLPSKEIFQKTIQALAVGKQNGEVLTPDFRAMCGDAPLTPWQERVRILTSVELIGRFDPERLGFAVTSPPLREVLLFRCRFGESIQIREVWITVDGKVSWLEAVDEWKAD